MQDESTEIDDGFGHWLAGFADGEGSFNIGHPKRPAAPSYNCSFSIGLRIDDLPILEEIERRTGIGRLSVHLQKPDRVTTRHRGDAGLRRH
jgi:hypothetical protein